MSIAISSDSRFQLIFLIFLIFSCGPLLCFFDKHDFNVSPMKHVLRKNLVPIACLWPFHTFAASARKHVFFDFVCVASLQDLYKHTFFIFFHETHVLVSCRVYIGTFDQRSAQRPPGSCLTSPCCRDFILFRIFAAQILVPLCVSLTRRHFGSFFGSGRSQRSTCVLTFF